MTDAQRQRVYDAENALTTLFDNIALSQNPVVVLPHGITVTLPPEARFGSLESIQTHVDRILRHPVIEMAYPRMSGVPITVRRRKSAGKAHYEDYPTWPNPRIAIHDGRNDWAMRELVVLHEVAHHLSYGQQHGPGFAEALLVLVKTVMGPEVGLALQVFFDDFEVDSRPKDVVLA